MKKKRFSVAQLLVGETLSTKGANKYLMIAMVFNIPFIGFIPYLTQAFTVILLFLFLRKKISFLPKFSLALAIATMIFQVFWFPFISQIVTLILLSFLYLLVNVKLHMIVNGFHT
jgi:hypothetical protein